MLTFVERSLFLSWSISFLQSVVEIDSTVRYFKALNTLHLVEPRGLSVRHPVRSVRSITNLS